MTTTGIILWSMAIGLLILGVIRKSKGDKTDKDEGAAHKKHKGGCCG